MVSRDQSSLYPNLVSPLKFLSELDFSFIVLYVRRHKTTLTGRNYNGIL